MESDFSIIKSIQGKDQIGDNRLFMKKKFNIHEK